MAIAVWSFDDASKRTSHNFKMLTRRSVKTQFYISFFMLSNKSHTLTEKRREKEQEEVKMKLVKEFYGWLQKQSGERDKVN